MKINTEKTLFANPQSRPEMFMYFIIVAGELIIQICRRWKKLGTLWNLHRRVAPLSSISVTGTPQAGPVSTNPSSKTDILKARPLMAILTLALILLFFGTADFVYPFNYFGSILKDTALLGLPMYWLFSSPEIIKFLNLKCQQMKARYGSL